MLFRRSWGPWMKRYINGVSQDQETLLPDHLEGWIDDEFESRNLGFKLAEAMERPSYHPSAVLKLYACSYLNSMQSSRRLVREMLRNVKVMRLLSRLSPDHKTVADCRKNIGEEIHKICAQLVEPCCQIGLLAVASVIVD